MTKWKHLIAIPCCLLTALPLQARQERDLITEGIQYIMRKSDDYLGFSAQERTRNQRIVASLKRISSETGREGWKIKQPFSYSPNILFLCESSDEGRPKRFERFGIDITDMSKERKQYPSYDLKKIWEKDFQVGIKHVPEEGRADRKIIEESENRIVYHWYALGDPKRKKASEHAIVVLEVQGNILYTKCYKSESYPFEGKHLSEEQVRFWVARLKEIPIT